MAADLILTPFADQGDKAAPPLTNSDGFVNLTEGYTKYYEISLESGDPQAKGVERAIQNYLFNLLTSNTQVWQQLGLSPWFAAMPGGYAKNAMVMRLVTGVQTPYRSLIDANNVDPIGNPASWEYIRTYAEITQKIPMPSGGLAGAAELISVTTNLNALVTGTYQIATDAVAQSSAAPVSPFDTVARAGMIECKTWVPGAGLSAAIQRYTDRAGIEFARGMYGGVWTGWTPQSSVTSQGDTLSYALDTGVANAIDISTTLLPALAARKDGAVYKIKVKVANTGACTIKDAIGIVPLVGKAAPLQGGELTANGEAWVQWNTSFGSAPGSYMLMANSGGGFPVGPGTKTNHAASVGLLGLRGLSSLLTSGNFTVPDAVFVLDVQGWGGGGGGGGAGSGGGSAGGGGGASYFRKRLAVTPGQVIAYVIGAGGGGAGPGGAGGNGTATTFGPTLTASPGLAGLPNPAGTGGGGGTTAVGGDVIMSGGSGTSGSALNGPGGAGGGAGGGGGPGGGGAQGSAGSGAFPGGGGGGGGPSSAGGAGSPGLIVVSW